MNNIALIATGLDIGNGRAKITIDGKSASIPAGYSEIKLKDTFSVIYDKHEYWFGSGILNSYYENRIDDHKYDIHYLRIVTTGLLAKWAKLYGSEIFSQARLYPVVGMPTGQFRNDSVKRLAKSAYDKAVSNGMKKTGSAKTPINWDINASFEDGTNLSFRVYSTFSGHIEIEGEVLKHSKQIQTGLSIVVDGGYGTVDIIVLETGYQTSIDPQTKKRVRKLQTVVNDSISINNGLVHAYMAIDSANISKVEYQFLADKNKGREELNGYISQVKKYMQLVLRQAKQDRHDHIDLYLFGGISELMTSKDISELKRQFSSVESLGQHANSELFSQVSRQLIERKK